MAIMYEPQAGMPTFVPDGMENDYLAKGYRTTAPPQSSTPERDSTPPSNNSESLNINSASLRELTAFGLSTAQAKELRDGRPFTRIEDLIAKIADVDWVSVSSRINFD